LEMSKKYINRLSDYLFVLTFNTWNLMFEKTLNFLRFFL
jgi:cob(I)alamin adenosyltransferase